MALFNRENPTNVIPPTSSRTEIRTSNRPGWLVLLGAIVAVLLVSTGLVFGGRWVYRSITNDSTKEPISQPTQSTKSTQNIKKPSTQRSPSTNKTPATPPSSSAKNNNQLPDNGPGEVAVLFIGASLAAAGLHYLINLRRQTS